MNIRLVIRIVIGIVAAAIVLQATLRHHSGWPLAESGRAFAARPDYSLGDELWHF